MEIAKLWTRTFDMTRPCEKLQPLVVAIVKVSTAGRQPVRRRRELRAGCHFGQSSALHAADPIAASNSTMVRPIGKTDGYVPPSIIERESAALPLTRGAVMGVATAVALQLKSDPDLWGHLRYGLDMLATHTVPSVDIYSFTSDRPWQRSSARPAATS
jgi:hypothetical protein